MKAFIHGDCGGVGSDSPGMVTKQEKKTKEQVKENCPNATRVSI